MIDQHHKRVNYPPKPLFLLIAAVVILLIFEGIL